MMWTHTLADWLRASIPGIILLGALGSIAAFGLLKILGWLYRKFLFRLVERFVLANLKPFILAQWLTKGYTQTSAATKLIVFAIFTIDGFFASTVLFFLVIIATIIYFALTGPQITALSFALLSLSGLLFIFWMRDAFAMAGIYDFLLGQDIRKAKQGMKDPEQMLAAYKVTKSGERSETERPCFFSGRGNRVAALYWGGTGDAGYLSFPHRIISSIEANGKRGREEMTKWRLRRRSG